MPSLSPSLPALGIKEDWKEVSYVKKLISEKKLAPTPTSGSEVRDKECPICFLVQYFICCLRIILLNNSSPYLELRELELCTLL